MIPCGLMEIDGDQMLIHSNFTSKDWDFKPGITLLFKEVEPIDGILFWDTISGEYSIFSKNQPWDFDTSYDINQQILGLNKKKIDIFTVNDACSILFMTFLPMVPAFMGHLG